MYSAPLAYLITFTVYGAWLHGDAHGSYRRDASFQSPNESLRRFEEKRLQSASETFNSSERQTVAEAFRELCEARGWSLYALNVRTNHCHIVLEAGTTPPKRVAAQLKASASRRLRQKENWPDDRKIWTEGASGRYLFDRRALDAAIRYVDEQ